MTERRLIEAAFPLEQASIDSVHEKNVRHGHISTLHIWPARRPLAACRAALIATLLPDPGTKEGRDELCKRIGGSVVKVIRRKQGPGAGKKEERIVKETAGGILHWGRETESKADLDFFREEIRMAYGGRPPRVLDPFAGGGAIPLEAMRLGCEVTAIDINPVAWFILKCTLEYPQRLAGQKRPLPRFVRSDRAFMESFFKAQGFKGAGLRSQLRKLGLEGEQSQQATLKDTQTGKDVDLQIEEHTLDADLAWHVRAWGWWIQREARRELAKYYPIYADFEPFEDAEQWRQTHSEEWRSMQLVPLRNDGNADVEILNREFDKDYLDDPKNARWIAKPAVAYLWARTVRCKNCRAIIPLLKTRWLAKKANKRVLLTITPNPDRTGVVFGVEQNVPATGGNNAQKREHDRRLGQGTMSRNGAWCPCCGKPGTVAMEMEDIRAEAVAGRFAAVMTAVVVDGPSGKEYRLPTDHELTVGLVAQADPEEVFKSVPFGIPNERVPEGASRKGGGSAFTVHLYGMNTWRSLFTNRQLLALGTLVRGARSAKLPIGTDQHTTRFVEPVEALLAVAIDKQADRLSSLCRWDQGYTKISNTFTRFALPILWDFAEGNPLSDATGNWLSCVEWVAEVIEHAANASQAAPASVITAGSATQIEGLFDAIVTDPPYYDAIPYSDLMDFFYVWLRRSTAGLTTKIDEVFKDPLGPKWNHTSNDGELVDDASRHGGDGAKSKQVYEDGMARVFKACTDALKPEGRLVIVFANKQPDAWETLVSAIIRSGFTVDGSWPIQTEMGNRTRALASAALASSVWLVCKKRPAIARAGWDTSVLQEMRGNIGAKLREFWDAGIRGPDFVWAATGPALEAYSKHPIVKKANQPNELMTVSEFLRSVRRLVVEFVVGRVLGEVTHAPAAAVADDSAAALDDVTTYYLLHRHDFGMEDAPAGACILYALSCNLSERDLADRYDLLMRTGGTADDEEEQPVDENADSEEPVEEGSGSTFRLKSWKQRRRPSLGTDPVADNARARRIYEETTAPRLLEETTPDMPRQRMVPLIDVVHRLMHLWADGNVNAVNEYIDLRGLRRSEPFRQVLQAVIELAPEGTEERSVAERVMNHLRARGDAPAPDLLARIES